MSPWAWFSRFSKVIKQFGIVGARQIIMCSLSIHLLINVSNLSSIYSRCQQHFFQHFQTKELGRLQYFLGIVIVQSKTGIAISQSKYALDILKETGIVDYKPIDMPTDPYLKLLPGQGKPYSGPSRYQRLVGKLNYPTITARYIFCS